MASAALAAALILAAGGSLPEPANYPGDWITQGDHPYDCGGTPACRGRSVDGNGAVVFELTVDTAGLPLRCDALEATVDDTLAQITCALLLRRARFEPAVDENGDAIFGIYRNKIIWTQGSEPPPLAYHDAEFTVASLPGGKRKAHFTVRRIISAEGRWRHVRSKVRQRYRPLLNRPALWSRPSRRARLSEWMGFRFAGSGCWT